MRVLLLLLLWVAPAFSQDATIYVYRLNSKMDNVFNPTVILDGQEIARLEKGQIFGVKLKPGEHRLEIFGKRIKDEPVQFSVEAGRRYYAKYVGGKFGSRRIVLTSEAVATKELSKLRPIEEGAIKDSMVFRPTELALKK